LVDSLIFFIAIPLEKPDTVSETKSGEEMTVCEVRKEKLKQY
jgi:hypothetical protein